ncbi:MAG: peptide chain release factor N(5)-glutamine methyltransferase [Fidelibacterota bacterium]
MTTSSPSITANLRIVDLIKCGSDYLQQQGIENPQWELEWLLCDLLSCSRMELYVNTESEISSERLITLDNWMQRRLAGEPLQYITGRSEFFGLPFHLNHNVLIPRPETERLVEVALNIAQSSNVENIVDVGTGSGCIAVSLASKLSSAKIVAVDMDKPALELARENAALNSLAEQIEFRQLDILSEEIDGKFDLLLSNPPYIPQNEIADLPEEIRDHEPRIALTDGNDGLTFYHRFASKGRDWVKEGGHMVMEVGRGKHPQQVEQIFTGARYTNRKMYKDYNGDDRVITIEV